MAYFKAVVKYIRRDGSCMVYIRVIHRRQVGHISTGKIITSRDLSKNNEIIHPYVLRHCSDTIIHYQELLNQKNISAWSVDDIIRYVTTESEDICFSEYARKHINRMISGGQDRNAKNYKMALLSLENYLGTNKLMFSDLTSNLLNSWVMSLGMTKRAKEMYPVCMRQVFKAALTEYNDYDSGNLRLKTNPWVKVSIPQADRAEKRAISPEACRQFFSAPLPKSSLVNPTAELGRDVAKLVLCLAGINTVDLFNLQKIDYQDGKICYRRAKTTKSRRDDAYIEMKIEPIIQHIFDKYLTDKDDPYLFNFHTRYLNSDSFCSGVNAGIKELCKSMGLKKSDWYSVYTFRHTWGTVAQNDCGATISEVAFAMNHSSGHAITRGYLKIDFSPAWQLNQKVIDFIFFSGGRSKQQSSKEGKKTKPSPFRITPRAMIEATAYYQGVELAKILDVGFDNLPSVMSRLMKLLPETIPKRGLVTCRIKNLDSGREIVKDVIKSEDF